ncbi:DUF885 domain-containing protein [Chryseobacterium lacus]|uniref:DUF885 domain-containing protein n=1 Tax=Chryseobacterium lacus TaxID=2058346 RepID=A0A368N0T2_9FLAO|nr:DUF885 domain-containing protein [Chryseobacterium lacus]RCU44112.1 DUF885 domain-containing protein [Chryseobacterium lacus]RST29043.1 DUF885 domain-containing protein [Chryseobacterium lacus]
MNNKIHLLFFIFVTLLTACQKKQSVEEKKPSANIDSVAAKYYEQYLKFYPLEATAQGDGRYNDQLPINISKDFISEEIAFYTSVQDLLKQVDYKNLTDDKKVIFDVLDFTLKDRIERYAYHPQYIPFTQFGGLPLDFPLLGSGKGSQPFHTEEDYNNWLRRMEKFPAWMDTATENFRLGIQNNMVLPRTLVMKMIAQLRATEITSKNRNENIFFGPLKEFPATISSASREKISASYHETITQKIIPAYTAMADFLEKEYLPKSRNTDGYHAIANGKNAYAYHAKSWTTTNTDVEKIRKIGEEEVAMLRSEMEKVKLQLGFQGTLEEFLAHLKTDPKAMPYRSSKEVLAAFNEIMKKIEPKLGSMFSVFPKTGFEIRQTEKFREASASAEYVQGTPDGKRAGIFYIPIPDPSKFNITSGMESLFLHEAIPGHHYQVALQQENENIPKFMRFGWFGAYGEGWAHYCETLGPEFDLYTNPYQKMGYLSDQMLRAVRLVIDTGLHTGSMSREQAIQYFLSNVAYDEASATAEIERYMAMPGQALSYKIGSIKIRELRNKYEASLGNKFHLAKFHDEILSQGCLPLSVLERKMELWANKQ